MKKLINNLFSDKYVNHRAVEGNFVLLLMYRFAYPFAFLLNRLGLSPNKITTLSLVFSILAFIALVYDQGVILFSFFWGTAVLLDFCDGTVARMANKVSKSAFRYDHMSDLFKIPLIILGAGLRYDDYLVWILAFSASFLFMYLALLNHDLGCIKKCAEKTKQLSNGEDSVTPRPRLRERYRIVAWITKHNLLYKTIINLQALLLTINGHMLLLFFLLPLSPEFAIGALSFLIFISLFGIRSRVATLLKMQR